VVLDDDEALLLLDTTGVELEALARAADEVRAERGWGTPSPTWSTAT
jgi:hypothetical protein